MMVRRMVIVLVVALLLTLSGTAGAEDLLIRGDVNADQKVDLQDVIFVLKLMSGHDMGAVSPGGDVNGDDRIGIQEAVYQLQTVLAVNDYLQPIIETYLEDIITETALADAAFKELERTFYLNGGTGPALKMPTVEFSPEGIDFSVDLGPYTPPDAPPDPVNTVQVLLYDNVFGAWGYGLNRETQTSFLSKTPHDNDFSSTYSLYIDGIRMISDGTVKDLSHTDPARGVLLHVITEAVHEFLVGAGNSAKIPAHNILPRSPAAATSRSVAKINDIQEKADQVKSLPVITGACPCPPVDMLAELQKSFSKQGINLTVDHLNTKESQPLFSCGDSFKALIRLGSDLEVLESSQKLRQRIQNNDFRLVEPAGYFRGAAYLLILGFWSWCDPSDPVCKCHFSWELVEVKTARILGAGFETRNCGNLETNFDSMLGEIETLGQLYMLSDNDYDIPYCDDGNPCTWDAYDLKTRRCVHRAKAASPPAACDDGDLCTVDDVCILGECVGKIKICDDNNPCTDDSCDPETGGCRSVRLADGTPCDDGDPVTENDVCTAGICRGMVNPDNPLPGVPFATGQPSFLPDPVTLNYPTTVSVPITTDTQKVAIRLWDTERPYPFVITYKDNLAGQNLAEIETIGINTNIYEELAMVHLEFDVYAGNYGGAYSRYIYDPSRSETHYIMFQDDLLGHTIEKVSDIPIAWLTVQLPF